MKKLCMAFLACMSFACLTLAACSFNQPEIMFNEGYLEEVTLGEPIMLDEYVDPYQTNDYTVTLTCDETGQERDLKMMGQWTTDVPGTYTLTYTVKSGNKESTISTKILVSVPKATWQYSTLTLVYRAGETMEFSLLKRNLNLTVKSYYGYQFYVKSVQFEGESTNLLGKTSYTFPKAGEYVFKFAVKTEDGQELTADQKISVRAQQVMADGAAEWMEANNITSYDYTYIDSDGKVSLDAGYYSSFIQDNVPYFAFNGKDGEGYGENTYMMVDFTGKNLPQIAFFCDEVTPSFTDGKGGILFSNGTSLNDGRFWSDLDASRLTVFGPNKAKYAEFDNKGRMKALGSVAAPCAISYKALQDGQSYRYIIGLTEVTNTSVTARILLINLTTGERVFDYKETYKGYSGPSGNIPLDLPDNYKGSIALYGRYGIGLNFDKVYMPITGVEDIYELDEAAEFRTGYKTQYELNSYANVRDYIDIPVLDYDFTVIDPTGEVVEIAEDGSFQYTKSGKYLLTFDPRQEGMRASSISVRVMYDLKNPFAPDFFEKEGAIMAGSDFGVLTNTKEDFISEGSQSIEYYTITAKDGTMTICVSKSFMEFVSISREVEGISFDVYSPKAVSYKLSGTSIVQDYTGEIPAETWTTLTVTNELCKANYESYKSQSYSIAICLYTADKFMPREAVYIDNIKLLISDEMPTISDGAKAFMEANNMTAYGYKNISDDMSASLYGGIYQGEWNTIKNDDVPYIAYNGNYGAGSYVVVDFTGKNVPQLCFNATYVTASLTDGLPGFYVHTGMLKRNGTVISPHDGGRVTFMGPNKIAFRRPDAEGRFAQFGYQTDDPVNSPLSINGLEDGVHYRYVIGIKSARVGCIEIELMLINLDTNTEVMRRTQALQDDAKGGLYITAENLSGNIIMYSRYNTDIKLDKVYAVYTGVSDIKAIDKVAEVLG